MLTLSDSLATKKIYNRSLIFYDSQIYSIQKQFKSKEDFILNNPSQDKNHVTSYLQTMVIYPSVEDSSPIQTLPLSCFTCGDLNIGVEICLDHSRKRLLGYAEKGEIPQLDVQIVPSCGMQLHKTSAATLSNGLLFNCDGEYTLDGDAQNGDTSHSELKRLSRSPSCGPILSKQLPVQKIVDLSDMDVADLFPHGAGQLHIYQAQNRS